MRLQLLDPAFAVQVVLGICGVLFALCVLATMYALFTIFERTKALVPEDGDRQLKWGERKAREFDRVWRGFMAPEVKRLRQLLFGAYLLAFTIGGIMLLLTAIFGTRVPT